MADGIQNDIPAPKNAIEKLRTALEELTKDLKDVQTENTQLKKQMGSMQVEQKKEIASLHGEIVALKDELRSVRAAMTLPVGNHDGSSSTAGGYDPASMLTTSTTSGGNNGGSDDEPASALTTTTTSGGNNSGSDDEPASALTTTTAGGNNGGSISTEELKKLLLVIPSSKPAARQKPSDRYILTGQINSQKWLKHYVETVKPEHQRVLFEWLSTKGIIHSVEYPSRDGSFTTTSLSALAKHIRRSHCGEGGEACTTRACLYAEKEGLFAEDTDLAKLLDRLNKAQKMLKNSE